MPCAIVGSSEEWQPQQLEISEAKVLEAHEFTTLSYVHSVIKLKTKLVLHLFSGRRRPGDYQDHLENMLQGCNGGMCNVVVLSIDIVLHMLGDLTNPESLRLWIDLVLTGIVLLVLGGPPCETWSAIRALLLLDKEGNPRKGPRPVRSNELLWGNLSLTKQERRSVDLGNALLRSMLALFYACARTCSTAPIMEHPKLPKDPQHPSSWKLPELRCIEQHDLGDAVHVSQCAFRSPSQKPTTLLTFNMPQLRHIVSTKYNGGRCTHADHEVVAGYR